MGQRSAPRKIEYRFWIAGREVDPEAFWAELQRLGGRAVVETVDLTEPAARPTPLGKLAAERGWK